MDINQVNSVLDKEYNCISIDFFTYKEYQFVKAYEKEKFPTQYRYFNISKENKVTEVKDATILRYFREKHEPVRHINY